MPSTQPRHPRGRFNLGEKLTAAWFQSVIARTAGFNSIDIGSMHDASLFFMVAFMFIGASPGSTGGGIKTTTARILLVCTRTSLRGKDEVLAYQRERFPPARILKAISVVVGSGGMVLGMTILIAFTSSPALTFYRSCLRRIGLCHRRVIDRHHRRVVGGI
jgi:trk system potassium uptake protein TrkH